MSVSFSHEVTFWERAVRDVFLCFCHFPIQCVGSGVVYTVATAFFFTVLPFFVRFCRVYVTFVSNALQRRF